MTSCDRWRSFRLATDQHGFSLNSPGYLPNDGRIDHDGPLLHAHCITGHTPPHPACSCGLYSTGTLPGAQRWAGDLAAEDRVYAAVHTHGETRRDRIVRDSQRSTGLQLIRVYVSSIVAPSTKNALTARYQVPVLTWRPLSKRGTPAGLINLVPPALRTPKETA